jgi:CHAD domain-containing protein
VSGSARSLGGKVARLGRRIRHRSETALRKSLKKLRYGIDFMRPVFRHGKQLQQTLGDINDAVVGE